MFSLAIIGGLAVGGFFGFIAGFVVGATERGAVLPRVGDEDVDAWGDDR